MRLIATIILLTLTQSKYSSSSVFAHNDYAGPKPFEASYELGVGFIEADVFLVGGELFVAHSQNEITPSRTLDALYLQPLANRIRHNNGWAYPGRFQTLTLMIDLKTDGSSTLPVLIGKLEKYYDIISSKNLFITVSGSMPDPKEWKKYPLYIWFDGRPAITYTDDQLKRLRLISANFKDYSNWNGKGELSGNDKEKLLSVVNAAHVADLPFRFWATPDFDEAWTKLMELKIDIVNTDHPAELIKFIEKK